MASNPECPAPADLKRLLDAALPESEQTGLFRHLEACPACQQRLQDLAAAGASWQALAGYLNDGKRGRGEALERAMDELREKQPILPTQDDIEEREEMSLDFLDAPVKPRQLGKFGSYEIVEVVGRGGMGIVFKALDPVLHRIVAVKVMAPQFAASSSARQRFLREARAAAAVCHEHVVTIHAVGEAKSLPYLVMQFVAGVSLQERLEKRGPLKLEEILRIGMQTAQGLSAAHAQGLVHRDIKPANILLENGVERVKITDFGLARAANDASITQTGVIVGTPQYMAPEQARGEAVDHRADLFSLGSVLYFMCTGQAPFQGDSSLAVMRRVCDEPPPPLRALNPNAPEWLIEIIARLQAKEPAERFSSAAEVAELLNEHLLRLQRPALAPPPLPAGASNDVPVAEPVWIADTASNVCWGRWLAAAGILLLLAGVGFAAYWFRSPFVSPSRQAASDSASSHEELVRAIPGNGGAGPALPDPSADSIPAIAAPRLSESKVEVRLAESFAQVRTGGCGRYLIFHLKRAKKLAVFDASTVRVVKEIDLPSENVVYACGRDKLMIVLPTQRLIQRWSLRTFAREKSVPYSEDQPVLKAAMGCSSAGPLLLWSGDKVVFFDVERMEPRLIDGEAIQGSDRWELEMRVSADGQTIAAWTPRILPSRYSIVRLAGDKAATLMSPDWQSHNEHWALPNADGSAIFRHGAAIYPANMKAAILDGDKDAILLPTEDPRFFLSLRKTTKDKDEVTIRATADRRSLLTVGNLESTTSSLIYTQRGLIGGEPRLHYLPSANVLLLLPESNDRVIFRPLDLLASLNRDGKNYLFVLSAPRTRACAGTEYVYPIEARSKVGGVRFKLESGPEGMTLSGGSRLRWPVPHEQFGRTANVIVGIRDASGQEIQHSFEIAVE